MYTSQLQNHTVYIDGVVQKCAIVKGLIKKKKKKLLFPELQEIR